MAKNIGMTKTIKALVLKGNGINCEREMASACTLAGAKTTVSHLSYLLDGTISLSDYQLLLLPGGFTFGDDLGAAHALACRIKYGRGGIILRDIKAFVADGNCILGICNGFQLLLKLGLLPGALIPNAQGRFENRWCHHKILPSHCIFTRGIDTLYLPVRHAEGQFIITNESENKNLIALKYATAQGHETLSYPENPNGSVEAIAGMTDATGRILGMMAHPEAAILPSQHPQWCRLKTGSCCSLHPDGRKIFDNAITWLSRDSSR